MAKARVACDTTIEARILGTLSMAQDSFDRSLAASTAQSAIDVAGMADAPLFVSGGLLALVGTYVHREPERRPARDRRPALEARGSATTAGAWPPRPGSRPMLSPDRGGWRRRSSAFAEALDLNGVGDFGELSRDTVLGIRDPASVCARIGPRLQQSHSAPSLLLPRRRSMHWSNGVWRVASAAIWFVSSVSPAVIAAFETRGAALGAGRASPVPRPRTAPAWSCS